jgi:hypothetical protein
MSRAENAPKIEGRVPRASTNKKDGHQLDIRLFSHHYRFICIIF